MKPIFSIFFLLLFFATNSQSQTVKVLNDETGFPIAGVLVYSKATQKSIETDAEGKFQLDAFSNTDTLVFDHLAFQNEEYTKDDIKKKDYEIFLFPDIILMQEFIVTTSNVRENTENLPYKIDVIQAGQLKHESAQTSAEILTSAGNVTVQKSQGGGGSPVLRGFEANKILLVLDGVRMNNVIYRSGHLQNSMTLDNNILDRAEIIFGPTSVIYGSDALGGVVHYYTKDPQMALRRGDTEIHGNAQLQYATANNTKIGHANFNYGTKKFGTLTAFTYSDFGNIRTGKNDNPLVYLKTGQPEWGLRNYYVETSATGDDQIVQNSDPRVQVNTAYKQYDFLQKFKYAPSKYLDVILNLQYSTSSNVDRYDKLTGTDNDGIFKYAEYGYGPQNRLFSSLKFFYKKENIAFTNVKATLAYQKIDEDRYSRRFQNTDKLYQFEDVYVGSMNLDFLKMIKIHRLNYGFEAIYNNAQSNTYYQDILTGAQTEAQTRYPNGGTQLYSAAMYANIKWHTTSKLVINYGFRYSLTTVQSEFIAKPNFVPLPFEKVNFSKAAPTSSISFVYFPSANWQINALFGSGYRAPNVDDYGKVRAKGNQVTVPNDELAPEFAYNAEISVTRSFGDVFSVNTTFFKTWLQDVIVRMPYQIEDNTTLEYDGEMYDIITNLNASTGFVQGGSVSLQGNWIFNNNDDHYLKLLATYNEFYGRYIDNNDISSPMAHIAPAFGRVLTRYNTEKFGTQFSFDYQGAKSLSDMGDNGEDNEAESTPDGYPAWYTLNYAANYNWGKHLTLQFSINNIADIHYRTFASGVSAPGRNFIFTLRTQF